MQRHFDFVLLGGGPASVSAAETLRAEGAKGSILLVSEEDCVPYGHSHLPKRFLLGAQPKERLLIHTEAYYRDHAIVTIGRILGFGKDQIEDFHGLLRE